MMLRRERTILVLLEESAGLLSEARTLGLCKKEQGIVETHPDVEVPAIQATYQMLKQRKHPARTITPRLARTLALSLNIAHD